MSFRNSSSTVDFWDFEYAKPYAHEPKFRLEREAQLYRCRLFYQAQAEKVDDQELPPKRVREVHHDDDDDDDDESLDDSITDEEGLDVGYEADCDSDCEAVCEAETEHDSESNSE